MEKSKADPRRSPHLVVIDGAQSGMVASLWTHPNPSSGDPWQVLDRMFSGPLLSPKQVQVAWIKHAQSMPAMEGEFPEHTRKLAEYITVTLRRLRERFPNLRVAYLSSRIYGGYAATPLNPEPYAYEGAFAVRWVIQSQIQGEQKLNFDPMKGPVTAPAVLWGPYLWADGVKPRKLDGLVWTKDDLGGDGTHPSAAGRAKVAGLLLDFLHNNPLASCWYMTQQPAKD